MPIVADQRPLGRDAAVVEDGLADELDLDAAVDALDRANEHVVGVVIGRRTRMRRDLILVIPRPDRERVANDDPARRRLPRRLEDVRARLVRTGGGMVDRKGTEAEGARLPVEHAAEDARRVEGRDAEPVDRAVGGDQRTGVAVRQERVVRDRRERGRSGRALLRLDLGFDVGHDAIHGPCQLAKPRTRSFAASGPHEPCAYRCTGGGLSSRGCMTRQVSSTPSWRVNRVLSPTNAA